MCQREKGAKQDDSPCASDEGIDWKSGDRREYLKVQTHALFTSLYLDDEQGYKHTAQPPLLHSLASAWRQYILNMPKITPGRNKWVSISDSQPTAVAPSLSVLLTFSLSSLSSHHFISPFSCYTPSVVLIPNVLPLAHPFFIPIHSFVLLHLLVSMDQLSSCRIYICCSHSCL